MCSRWCVTRSRGGTHQFGSRGRAEEQITVEIAAIREESQDIAGRRLRYEPAGALEGNARGPAGVDAPLGQFLDTFGRILVGGVVDILDQVQIRADHLRYRVHVANAPKHARAGPTAEGGRTDAVGHVTRYAMAAQHFREPHEMAAGSDHEDGGIDPVHIELRFHAGHQPAAIHRRVEVGIVLIGPEHVGLRCHQRPQELDAGLLGATRGMRPADDVQPSAEKFDLAPRDDGDVRIGDQLDRVAEDLAGQCQAHTERTRRGLDHRLARPEQACLVGEQQYPETEDRLEARLRRGHAVDGAQPAVPVADRAAVDDREVGKAFQHPTRDELWSLDAIPVLDHEAVTPSAVAGAGSSGAGGMWKSWTKVLSMLGSPFASTRPSHSASVGLSSAAIRFLSTGVSMTRSAPGSSPSSTVRTPSSTRTPTTIGPNHTSKLARTSRA